MKQPQVLTPFIHGKPGVGKSAIVFEIAQMLGIAFIDLRLAQLESADIRGIPHVDEATNSSKWYPPETIPYEGFENIPVPGKHNKGKFFRDGGILFLDEFNRARFDVFQAAFELVLDRRCGTHEILDNWFIVAAGNLGEEDNTEVTEMNDAALNNRFAHFTVEDAGLFDCWVKWAETEDVHSDVLGFIKSKRSYLYTDSVEGNYSFCTPRTWVKFSNILKQNADMDPIKVTQLVGKAVINSAALAFTKYLEEKTIVTPEDIVNRYNKTRDKFATMQRDQVYSVITELGTWLKDHAKLDKKNLENIHKFMSEQLDDDHKMAFIRDINAVIVEYEGTECEFIDAYLDGYDEMNDVFTNILAKASGRKIE
jgi:hypothetical protein